MANRRYYKMASKNNIAFPCKKEEVNERVLYEDMEKQLEWREIFDGYYEVSEDGDVRRKRPHPLTFGGVGKHLKQFPSRRGYLLTTLCRDGVCKKFSTHSLVASAFLGQRPEKMQINHKDGNKLNNHYSNLEYISGLENMRHARDNGFLKPVAGKKHYKVKRMLENLKKEMEK